MPADFAVK